MTLGELLTKEGITLTNHDRNRIGILIGAKAKELDITKTRKEESNGSNKYVAIDYDEAFAVQMLIIVREYIANPPVPPKKVTVEQPKKKKGLPKVTVIQGVDEIAKFISNDAKQAEKDRRQQEWLAKRAKK